MTVVGISSPLAPGDDSNDAGFEPRRAVEWARMLERSHLHRTLQGTVLPGLETLVDANADAARLRAEADRQATSLRRMLGRSADDVRGHASSPIDAPAQLARHQERGRVGAHLHDTVLQILEFIAGDAFGTGLASAKIAALADAGAHDLRRWLDSSFGGCSELVPELRRVADEARHQAAHRVELVMGRIDSPPRGDEAAALAGAVREALTNTRKHARASRVVVRVEARDGVASVSVTDDGVGMQTTRPSGGLGLQGSIIGRMGDVGGHAAVESRPGSGTRITLTTAARSAA